MLTRFCLYGFLKNQRYYEPFLLLAFLDAGLSFTSIGVLIAIREISVNLMEVPSGAIADLYGRRRAMVLSFVAYIASFVIFGLGSQLWHFAPAMVLFGIGDAFRSGTHKSMILTWLRIHDRKSEKVAIYGRTRSWSKTGSAVSVPIATAIVLLDMGYSYVFWLSILPYLANLINLATYPKALDGERRQAGSRGLFGHLWRSALTIWRDTDLRRLLLEATAMGGGVYKSVKDYVQPTAKAAALGLPILVAVDGHIRTAVLIGIVYVVLAVLEAVSARRAHRLATLAGDNDRAAIWLWWAALVVAASLTICLLWSFAIGAVVAFVAFAVIFNIYRPIMVSRVDDLSREEQSATILSVESQGRALWTLLLAPVIGWAVDLATTGDSPALWPVGAGALVVVLLTVLFVLPRRGSARSSPPRPLDR